MLCTYSFTQATAARGRVSERVRHGLLELVLDVPAGDQLLRWTATPHYPLDGHFSFYQSSEFMARETVSFQEVFEAGADLVGAPAATGRARHRAGRGGGRHGRDAGVEQLRAGIRVHRA